MQMNLDILKINLYQRLENEREQLVPNYDHTATSEPSQSNEITARSLVLLEKLTATQLVKKFPAFMGHKFHYHIHKRLPPVPSQSQMHSIPRPRVTFRNKLFLQRRAVSPSPNPKDGEPPHVGCPRLLIQYICSYPPHLDAVSSIRNPSTFKFLNK
jgi:hypothetical protein